jgi:hypothetical protein
MGLKSFFLTLFFFMLISPALADEETYEPWPTLTDGNFDYSGNSQYHTCPYWQRVESSSSYFEAGIMDDPWYFDYNTLDMEVLPVVSSPYVGYVTGWDHVNGYAYLSASVDLYTASNITFYIHSEHYFDGALPFTFRIREPVDDLQVVFSQNFSNTEYNGDHFHSVFIDLSGYDWNPEYAYNLDFGIWGATDATVWHIDDIVVNYGELPPNNDDIEPPHIPDPDEGEDPGTSSPGDLTELPSNEQNATELNVTFLEGYQENVNGTVNVFFNTLRSGSDLVMWPLTSMTGYINQANESIAEVNITAHHNVLSVFIGPLWGALPEEIIRLGDLVLILGIAGILFKRSGSD